MAKNIDALHAQYLINGIRQEATPAGLLEVVSLAPIPAGEGGEISDETMERTDSPLPCDPSWPGDVLDSVLDAVRGGVRFPLSFPEYATRVRIATSLADTLWLSGHYRLEDLTVDALWHWDSAPMGAMAAFYASAGAAAEYLDALGVHLRKVRYEEDSGCDASFPVAGLLPLKSVSEEEIEETDAIVHWTGRRMCAATWKEDPASWLVYIPFDSCPPRLGGSVLASLYGSGGEPAPEVNDPDYFVDCYEVVRELVEDGIVTAGVTVGSGGLAAALDAMCPDGGALTAECPDGADAMHRWYAGIPGVVIQISDDDFDYLDAEMTLQDIAFYPVGHPGKAAAHGPRIRFRTTDESSVSGILQALLHSHSAEGED